MTGLEWVQQNLALLLPLVILQLGLMIAALIDLARRPSARGPKWIWVLVIILVNTIGPIIYFLVGRGED
ncbi:MAG: PLDc_N domain-containing protein [Chloroflexi bacterium]|nr:PLDc_N domain-containing protein [Chloroflexota bacterium]MBK7918239.1 PLDc_N domain-containing protein [Chloroflexota bacterium]